MKIAFVCPSFYPHLGGVETVVFQLASNLAARGIEVTVLTQNNNKQLAINENIHNFTIHRFNEVGFGELKISFDLLKYLQKNSKNYDLIHVHNYHSFPALCVAITKKKPIVFSPHYHGTGHTVFTHLLHYPYRYVGKFIFSKSDAILCDLDAEALLIQKHFSNIEKPMVIPLGIDVPGIQLTKIIKNTPKYILSVGRLEGYKNVDVIIRSLQFVNCDINLIIVGNGPELQTLKDLTGKLNFFSRISFLRDVSNKKVFSLLKNAKAFVTMSSMEAYGLSFLEAVAAEIGIVASDIPAHRELIKRFKISNISLLYPNSSPKVLAKAINLAILKPAQIGKKLPLWELVTEQTLIVYKKILK